MPDTSPNLSLPYLLPAQAQKHVTHNEALERLDALAQLVVEGFGATTPPADPGVGQIWAVGGGAGGSWSGQGGKLALRVAGDWLFLAPREGWRAWGRAEAELRIWRGSSWQRLPHDQLDGIGIATTSDATNRLSVVSHATLFSHAGAGHQMKINKAGAAQTASLMFQSNWDGRAEMGLTGNDDFSVKVSADGSTWVEGLRINRSTGAAAFLAGLTLAGSPVFARSNILGTVAQSAGLPTGAVIQRGSGANGEFVRFADGTLICAHVLTASASAAVGWTYPSVFAAVPAVSGTAQATVLACVMLDAAPTATAASLSVRDKADARRADVMRLMAVGRWF
ncbi:DUF2793 domain-containing protein [Gemmobacter serpentinus]|uniref:DUF2793 domain-containing protein n=1 Tax=Gemmobacter serpentinus TaxID=2652247 RepID=UPI00124F3DB4|nr:DUF2793 domain-containing protein [Gemmobacter serpentinus]